ncbi:MAG: hypothetical protein LBS18_01330 [Clostridiales bacterium]|nr:hypothetical protein [Clostridiales bacterium]
MRNYIKLGIPIRQAAKIVAGADINGIDAALQRQKREIEKKVDKNIAFLRAIARQRAWLAEISELCEKITIEDRPPLYRLTCTNNRKALQSKDARKFIGEWTGLLPITMLSGLAKKEDIGPDNVVEPGLAIFAGEIGFLSTVNSPYITYYHPRRCVKTIVRVSGHARDYYSMTVPSLKLMEANGLRVTGDILSISIANKVVTRIAPEDPSDYVLAWIPID